MHWLISLLIVVVSALLWRIRGGLRFWGHKAPLNKIWYAVFIGVLCLLKNKGIEISVNATISTLGGCTSVAFVWVVKSVMNERIH